MSGTYIYVFGPLSGPYKIGYAANLQARASGIRGMNSHALPKSARDHSAMWHTELMPDEEEARIVELEAHHLLDAHRIVNPKYHLHRKRCEWFDVSLVKAVRAVREASLRTQFTFPNDPEMSVWIENLRAANPGRSVGEIIRAVIKWCSDGESGALDSFFKPRRRPNYSSTTLSGLGR